MFESFLLSTCLTRCCHGLLVAGLAVMAKYVLTGPLEYVDVQQLHISPMLNYFLVKRSSSLTQPRNHTKKYNIEVLMGPNQYDGFELNTP